VQSRCIALLVGRVTCSGGLFQRVRRENVLALDTSWKEEPTAGDLFAKGLFPGCNGL
jgi:hypothetical protein